MPNTNKQTDPSNVAFWKTRSGKNALIILAIITLYPLVHSYLIKNASNGPAPDFSGTFLSGERFQLQDFEGKPLLIHFWATWCEICAHEMPDIERLAQKYQVLNIAIQSGSNLEVINHAKSNGMNKNIIVNDSKKQLESLYNTQAVPASFVVNSQGEITYSKHGYSTYNQLSKQLNQADE